jgi:membrane protein insertase Oxa1/YidC/SpoIIIJ
LLAAPHQGLHRDVLKSRRRTLFFMAAGLFLLFYPFPAVMVYYFTLANALDMAMQRLIRPFVS